MNHAEHSCGVRPYAEATLGEHREFGFEFDRSSSLEAILFQTFRVPTSELAMICQKYPLYDGPMIERAIRACFPTWELISQGGAGVSPCPNVAEYHPFALAPGRIRHFAVGGTNGYRLPSGQYRAIYRDIEGPLNLTLFGRHADIRELRSEARQLQHWMRGHRHYLQGQAIRPDGTLLPKPRQLTWSDVILEPQVLKELLWHTVEFMERRPHFQSNHIPQRRGILLHGPPGNGKTMIGKVLAALSGWTFLYVTARHMHAAENMRDCFQLARRLRPTILFFEDIDFFACRRERNYRDTTLGEALAQLDGLERNDGLIVIGTTNDLEVIDPSVKDRPSRFDVVLRIDPPDQERRQRLFARFWDGRGVPESLFAYAADNSDGYSAAQLKELAMQTLQQAILGGRVDDAGLARPTRVDLDAALSRVNGKPRKSVGFQLAAP